MDVKNTLLDNEDFGCDGGTLMAAAVCLYFGSNRGSSHTGWDSPSVADFYIYGKCTTIVQDLYSSFSTSVHHHVRLVPEKRKNFKKVSPT